MASASSGHHELLKVHCRLCGQKRVDPGTGSSTDKGPGRGVVIKNHPQLCRWLRYLHDIEVERESDEIYPLRACDGCIGRLRNVSICFKDTVKKAMENVFELATKLHTEGNDDQLRKLSRQFPAADFWAHSSTGMCSICDDSQKDSFPSIDFKSHLLIEIDNDQGAFDICKFSKTDKPVVPKRVSPDEDDSEKTDVNEDSNSANNDKTASDDTNKASESPAKPEAKKAKLEEPQKSVPTAKVSSISSGKLIAMF